MKAVYHPAVQGDVSRILRHYDIDNTLSTDSSDVRRADCQCFSWNRNPPGDAGICALDKPGGGGRRRWGPLRRLSLSHS